MLLKLFVYTQTTCYAFPYSTKHIAVADAYLKEEHCCFGGSYKILTDTGSEFINKQLRIKHIFPLAT